MKALKTLKDIITANSNLNRDQRDKLAEEVDKHYKSEISTLIANLRTLNAQLDTVIQNTCIEIDDLTGRISQLVQENNSLIEEIKHIKKRWYYRLFN